MNRSLPILTLFAALLCATGLPTQAADVEWMTDTDKAVLKMRKKRLPLLIYLTSSNCHFCEKMKKESYRDPKVAEEINKSFVAVAVHRKDATKLIKVLKIRSYPTTVVISPENKILDRINGYLPAEKLKQRLAAVTKKSETR